MTGFFRAESGRFGLFIRVTPNAAKDEIRGLWRGPGGDDRLCLRVAAPPDRGRANKAVIALLAKALGIPKSALSIAAGETDRLKTVIVREGAVSPARIEALASPA